MINKNTYVVILNWRGALDTIECVESIRGLRDTSFKLVVCDNASGDGSYEAIRKWLLTYYLKNEIELVELSSDTILDNAVGSLQSNSVTLIQNQFNGGYAFGNNVGVMYALAQNDCDFVWILNNDTVVTPEALVNMIEAIDSDKRYGICGCRLVYYSDRSKIQALGGVYNSWLGVTSHFCEGGDAEQVFDNTSVTSSIDYIVGASMLIKREVFDNVGLFCEDYFLYFEELDFIYRAVDSGYRIYVECESIVYHKEGSSTGAGKCSEGGKTPFIDALEVRNRLLFARKFHRYKAWVVRISLLFVLFNRARRGKWRHFREILPILLGVNRSDSYSDSSR